MAQIVARAGRPRVEHVAITIGRDAGHKARGTVSLQIFLLGQHLASPESHLYLSGITSDKFQVGIKRAITSLAIDVCHGLAVDASH